MVEVAADVADRCRALCPAPLRVEFYPYRSFESRIRRRPDGSVRLRISHRLHNAPADVLVDLAAVLLARLERRRVPKPALNRYRAFVATMDTHADRLAVPRRKQHAGPVGAHHDLAWIQAHVLTEYFADRDDLDDIGIGWSHHAAERRLGHFDATSRFIMISRVLDDARVPEWVVESVVHHELLHAVVPPTVGPSGRRQIHHAAFRAAERRFARHDEVEHWLRHEYPKLMAHRA